jgi:hypothetical protein
VRAVSLRAVVGKSGSLLAAPANGAVGHYRGGRDGKQDVEDLGRPAPQTGTKVPATHVKRMVNASKPEAGSAGIPGFDDAKCQKLLNDVLSAYAEARNATARGDARKAWEAQGRGERTQAYLEDHCLVVY